MSALLIYLPPTFAAFIYFVRMHRTTIRALIINSFTPSVFFKSIKHYNLYLIF